MSNKSTKPFNLEHAKAGAPYSCRDGREATVLKWDCRDGQWPIVGVFGKDDCSNEWSAEGVNNEGMDDHLDLVMTPLGFVDGKPVFVGDELFGGITERNYTVKPHHSEFGGMSWPAPTNVYPETGMSDADLVKAWNDAPPSGPMSRILRPIVNAALRHAIDTGQLVVAPKKLADFTLAAGVKLYHGSDPAGAIPPERERAIAIAMRTACEQHTGMTIPMNPDAVIATVK